MEKKGFFKFNKISLTFIGLVILFEVIMFSPLVYDKTTATGTSLPFIFVNIVLFVAPILSLIDGYLRGRAEKKGKKIV